MASEVVFTGYVPDDDLPFLYNGADLFVYPSLYEGFGLPPLEAMACGCPTVTSDSSSLPEVVGDAGLIVNPNSSADLVEAMARVLMEPGLAEALRNKGLARAARFSWDRCVQETLDIYSRVTGK
jgi:glycosyltransferase involved in cell wall biosynthesis